MNRVGVTNGILPVMYCVAKDLQFAHVLVLRQRSPGRNLRGYNYAINYISDLGAVSPARHSSPQVRVMNTGFIFNHDVRPGVRDHR